MPTKSRFIILKEVDQTPYPLLASKPHTFIMKHLKPPGRQASRASEPSHTLGREPKGTSFNMHVARQYHIPCVVMWREAIIITDTSFLVALCVFHVSAQPSNKCCRDMRTTFNWFLIQPLLGKQCREWQGPRVQIPFKKVGAHSGRRKSQSPEYSQCSL